MLKNNVTCIFLYSTLISGVMLKAAMRKFISKIFCKMLDLRIFFIILSCENRFMSKHKELI
jgi:hypothetical protein